MLSYTYKIIKEKKNFFLKFLFAISLHKYTFDNFYTLSIISSVFVRELCNSNLLKLFTLIFKIVIVY